MPHRIALIVLASLATLSAGRADAQAGGAGSRAEEEASRPLRLIIEAAKIKPKARPVEAASRPAAVPARSAPPQTDPPTAPPAPIVVVPSDPAAPPQSTVATVDVQATPREPAPQPVPLPVPAAPAEAEAQAEPAAALPPLKLRSLVEPVTPRHLAGRLRGEVRVEVALNVAADGSVSEASVTASSHPQMNAAVLEAVRQWRYEPAARSREHAVQVVMRPDS